MRVVRGLIEAAGREALVLLTLYSPFMWARHLAGDEVLHEHLREHPAQAHKGLEISTENVLTLVAADRPGLLYTVATTIAENGANLHTAKITTLGERAEDVFLISGGDLRQSSRRIQLESELMERLKVSA